MPPSPELCNDNGGTGIGAGHICYCIRRKSHPLDSPRPHGCSCMAMWAGKEDPKEEKAAVAETKDAINPSHYQGFTNGAEVIDISENLGFLEGNIVKYAARLGKKDDELQEAKKIQWYANRLVEKLERQRGMSQS